MCDIRDAILEKIAKIPGKKSGTPVRIINCNYKNGAVTPYFKISIATGQPIIAYRKLEHEFSGDPKIVSHNASSVVAGFTHEPDGSITVETQTSWYRVYQKTAS